MKGARMEFRGNLMLFQRAEFGCKICEAEGQNTCATRGNNAKERSKKSLYGHGGVLKKSDVWSKKYDNTATELTVYRLNGSFFDSESEPGRNECNLSAI